MQINDVQINLLIQNLTYTFFFFNFLIGKKGLWYFLIDF